MWDSSPRGWVLFHHTSILKHIRPLSAGSRVAVLQVLPEVVGPIEFLAGVALAELVDLLQMTDSVIPVLICRLSRPSLTTAAHEFFTAVAANIDLPRVSCTIVESPIIAVERGARPAVPADVEAILMTLCFVFVFKPVTAEVALILFLGFVGAKFFLSLKLLRLLGTTVTHKEALESSHSRLAIVDFPRRRQRPAFANVALVRVS